MFRTKKDVDLHCKEVLKKCNDKEANLRCLNIAQQYLNVNDFDSAKKYILRYISEKNDSYIAHKILAQCYEHFGDKENALREYKYSLTICSKQSPLILKVCELLVSNGVSVDKNELQHWLGKAECQFPYHPIVFELKKRLSTFIDSKNPESVESVLLDELKSKPKNSSLHTQLLTFYEENGRIREAYEKIHNNLTFLPTLQWYQCANRVCKMYRTQFPTSLNENFYANYLFVLERTLALSAQDVKMHRKSIPECISFLASFDEVLTEAADLVNKSERFLQILHHMCGQLCFSIAILLFRKAKWENNHWPDYMQLISPLLLLSTAENFKLRPATDDSPFGNIIGTCIQLNIYRISQAGFVLFSMAKESRKNFMEKIFHYCSSNSWKQRICDKIYNTSETKKVNKSSFFLNYNAFNDLPRELTKTMVDNIDHFVSVVEITQPSSLHHLVWLGMQCIMLSEKETICDMLLPIKFSSKMNVSQFSHNTSSGSFAESLCKLDVDAFLYACVYCGKSSFQQLTDSNKLSTTFSLPADVSKSLCRPELEQWWEYACQMVTQTIPEENFSRARSVLQRGIECIRLEGSNALPLELLVLLGRTFASKATIESDSNRATALESRAALYWKAAIPLLEKIVRNELISISSKSMFEYFGKLVSKIDASKLYSEGKRFLGMHNVKENDYFESLLVNGENYDEIENIVSVESPSTNVPYDEKLLQNVHEQNTQILEKLETLFNKQELLSSNQLQLFETVSSLSKRFDDFLIITNDEYSNILSTSNILPTKVSVSTNVSNTSYLSKPTVAPSMPSLATQNYVGSSLYSLPPVQTNFPMFPHAHSALPPVGNLPSCPPFVNSFLPNPSAASSHLPFSPVSPFFAETKSINSNIPSDGTLSVSKIAFDTTPKITKLTSLTNDVTRDLSKSLDIKTPERQSTPSTQHSFHISTTNSSIVQSPSVQVPDECEESDSDERTTERDPIPDFKPIIPLPDEVEVKTGEEDEETVFESRAKLYRFVDREWKERGTGVLKMLKNPKTGRVRVLMRRDIVHKICANHFLSDSMTLTPQSSSDRAWVYCAGDFSDEHLAIEQFSVKFKTVELAEEFKKKFDEYKVASSASSSVKSSPVLKDSKKPVVLTPSKLNSELKTVEDDAKATKLGGFTFLNSPIIQSSPTPKEELQPKEEAKKPTPFASFSAFETATKPPTNEKLFQSSNAAVTTATTTTTTIFTFGNKYASTPAPSEDSAIFASFKGGIDFSSLSKNADTNAFAKSKDFKGFAGAGSKVFGSTVSNSIPSTVQAILKSVPGKPEEKSPEATLADQEGSNEGEFVPTAEFAPVIPLPELVKVTTGEEGLELVYEGQCKLFRFVDEQWKERGVGKMKLLRDTATGNVRMVMRRDQVHKVCCNQWLTTNLELKPLKTSDKALCWIAPDFSEGESKIEQLCIRFKTVEQAQEFLKVIEQTKASLPSKETSPPHLSDSSAAAPTKLPALSEMFKRDAGSWECQECYTSNKSDADSCVCCQTLKEGSALAKPSENLSVASGLTSKSDTKFTFGTTAGNSETSGFSFATANNIPTISANKFSFGVPPNNVNLFSTLSSDPPGFTPTFGTASSIVKSESGGLLFGPSSSFTFDQKTNTNDDSLPNTVVSVSSPNASPVSIFGGTGTAKSSTSAYDNFSFKLNDEVSVTLSKPNNEISGSVSHVKQQESKKSSSQSSDEVEFVSETNISEEDKRLAERLMLPAAHFAYKYSDKACKGCVGCDPEDRQKNIEKSKLSELKTNIKTPNTNSVGKDETLTNTVSTSATGFVFGASGENTAWMNKTSFNFGNIFNSSNVSNNGDISTTQKTDGEGDTDDEKDASVVSNDQEPYFEPIIPLPKTVEVRTGEEEEKIEFCERAKIFRYDQDKREWKERGVGDLKILHHPIQGSFRLLLRREQVHKVVLNQRITTSLVLQPMATSTTSWCWFGMNLPEENDESVLEKLAARFKTEEIRDKFQSVLNSCIERLENPGSVAVVDEATNDDEEKGEIEEEVYEGEYDYVDEQGIADAMEDLEDGGEIMFESEVTLQVTNDNMSAQYDGYIKLVKSIDDEEEDNENEQSFVIFSTDTVPALYKMDVNNHAKPFLESTCVVFPNGNDNKMILQFVDEENAELFHSTFEALRKVV